MKHLYKRIICRSRYNSIFLHFLDSNLETRRLLCMATITLLATIRYVRIVNFNDCECIFTYVCTNPMLLLLFIFYFVRSIPIDNLAGIISHLLHPVENTFTDRHLNTRNRDVLKYFVNQDVF